MRRTRAFLIGTAVLAALARVGAQAPAFQVDPFWPKPLPNHWLFGSITGIAVDAQDHVWVVHRGAASLNARTEIGLASDPPTAEACCLPAPFVLRFDPSGRVVSHWGGPGKGYDWPQSPGGITVDAKGNVWIAAAGPVAVPAGRGRGGAPGQAPPAPPPPDAHVLKFSGDGTFLLQIGRRGETSGGAGLNRPMAMDVDVAADEVYVADGLGNTRVAVFDATTGAFKRQWTANGSTPFDTVSCVKIAKDGLVYVCDRRNNRIQIFRKDGAFVKEALIATETRGQGSVWSVAFSSDPRQRLLYVADGSNQKVWVLDRGSLATVSSVGTGGRGPGQFFGVGSVAVDSAGNLYTGETYEGKRLQKFVAKGGR